MPETAIPALSVVVASVNGRHLLGRCLASLRRQREREALEVIVALWSEDGTEEAVAAEHPGIRIVRAGGPQPIPALWSLGIRAARAEVVATTEDHCLFEEDWALRIREAHRASGAVAIGGAIENASGRRAVDRAAYICEYARFMRPFPAGAASILPGPNVAYKRRPLEEACGDLLDEGVWDHVLQARLRQRGLELRRDPTIVAYHAKQFGLGEFLAQRYHFGRAYAAARVARASTLVRAFFVAICLFLPPLFLWRYATTLLAKRRGLGALVRTSPLLVLFASVWSVGEFAGYAFGDGGSSLRVK